MKTHLKLDSSGSIENWITLEDEEVPPENWVECPDNQVNLVQIGGTVLNSVVTPKAPQIRPRHITQLAFANRFTQAERVSMDLASFHNPALAVNNPSNLLAAGIRDSLKQADRATYVDLDRTDTRVGVQALEGILLTVGRASQILDNPVQDSERPQNT